MPESEQKERVAGRMLDAEVTEKVMGESPVGWQAVGGDPDTPGAPCIVVGGWTRSREEAQETCDSPYGRANGLRPLPVVDPYSTDIATAWKVVELWRAKGDGFQLDSLGFEGENWRCGFMDASYGGMEIYWVEAATAPLAICLAALAAVEASGSRSDLEAPKESAPDAPTEEPPTNDMAD